VDGGGGRWGDFPGSNTSEKEKEGKFTKIWSKTAKAGEAEIMKNIFPYQTEANGLKIKKQRGRKAQRGGPKKVQLGGRWVGGGGGKYWDASLWAQATLWKGGVGGGFRDRRRGKKPLLFLTSNYAKKKRKS